MQTVARLRQLVSRTAPRARAASSVMSKSGQRATHDLSPASLFSTKDWVCVVSGGGTGIGLMASQALVACGAKKVYILGRRLEALKTAAEEHGKGKFVPLQCDITDVSSIQEAANNIKEEEGLVHLLINNAGISGPKHEVEKGDESAEALRAPLDQSAAIDVTRRTEKELLNHGMDDWRQVFDINVFGHYFSSAVFLPLLAAATAQTPGFSSSIINIDSISGITKTTQHHVPYNVSKAAGIQLNRMLAQEFSRVGVKVRVNSICPGIFPSEMTASESDDKQKSHIDADGYRDKKNIKAGRPGRDEDMLVVSLAVNQYINGENIVIDGGYLLGNP